jgi:hypothetical protein
MQAAACTLQFNFKLDVFKGFRGEENTGLTTMTPTEFKTIKTSEDRTNSTAEIRK